MGDVVSQLKLYIDGPMGNFQLRRVKSFDPTSERDAEVVTAIGVTGGAGYRFKEGGGEITLEVYEEQGLSEVNWRREQILASSQDRRFSITAQYVGGMRWQFQNCIVAQCSPKSDDQGSHMMTVKIKFLDVKQLPSA